MFQFLLTFIEILNRYHDKPTAGHLGTFEEQKK